MADVQYRDGRYTATVIVSNDSEGEVHTRYEGVTFHAYDQSGGPALVDEIGVLEPGAEWRRERALDRFPFLVTASSEGTEILRDCWRPTTEAEIRGYVGHYDEATNVTTEDPGHVWEYLDTRPAVGSDVRHERNELPLGETYLREAKCRAQNYDRVRRFESPSFPLPLDTAWMDEPLPRDGSRQSADARYLGEVGEDLRRDRATEAATIAADSLPDEFASAIDDGEIPDVELERALEMVGDLEETEPTSIDELPSCERANVECSDDRWSNCTSGEDAYDRGALEYRIWYFTTVAGRTHGFTLTFRDDW